MQYRISANRALLFDFSPPTVLPTVSVRLAHTAWRTAKRGRSAAVMAEQGGVGIVFHATRSGRCLLVSPVLLALPVAPAQQPLRSAPLRLYIAKRIFLAYPLWVFNLRGHPCLHARPPAAAPVSCLWSAAVVLPAHSHSFGVLCARKVKSLVPGGAAEQACAVEPGHQIIAIGDIDVSSSTLEEVRR